MAVRLPPARLAFFGVLASPVLVAALALVPADLATPVAQVFHGLALVTAMVLMFRAANRGDAAMRRPRQLFAAALGCTVLANLIVLAIVASGARVPVPSPADPISLLWIPLVTAGVWIVPGRVSGRASSVRIAADAAVIGASALVVSWTLVLGPITQAAGWNALERATQLAYPIADVLVVSLVIALLPRARPDLRKMLNWAVVGLVFIAVADSGAALSSSVHGTLRFGWADIALQAGIACIVVSTVVQPSQGIADDEIGWIDHYLPYLPVLVAVPVTISHVTEQPFFSFGSVAPLRFLVLTLIVRQVLYTRELSTLVRQHRQDARHDALTGLANRPSLIERLTIVLNIPDRSEAALLLVDLDGFKEINDNFGHDHGDGVLRSFGDVLRSFASADTMVARLGGDEFAVFVVGTGAAEEAARLGEELGSWRRISCIGGSDVQLLASVGMTTVLPQDTPIDVLRRADLAMYDAKRARSLPRYTEYTDHLGLRAQRRNLLSADLVDALARDEFSVVYQPIFDLRDQNVVGAEALLRWHHPHFGPVPPDEFIEVAEENGQIFALGAWVLDQTIGQVAAWDATGLHMPQVFVNVSARQVTMALPGLVAKTLERHGVGPDRLTLEVTESQAPDLAGSVPMRSLRESGVRIALDDFGAGYSTFAQLSRLPLDVLKIDRAFVADLGSTAGRRVIEAVVALANTLGLQTVIEGIEDAAQAVAALEAGADLCQGYHFSRPVSALQVAELMEGRRHAHVTALPRQRAQSLRDGGMRA